MSKSYRLIASDMDGTLLNDAHRMSEKTKKVLCDLMYKHGVRFLFATGRHCLAVEKTRNDFIAYTQDYGKREQPHHKGENVGFFLVSSNGARIHNSQNKLVREHNLDADIVRDLYMKYGLPHTTRKAVPNTGETDMISISAYTTDAWFMSSEFYTEEEIRSKFGMKPFLVPYPTNQESPEELTKDLNEQEKEWYKHKNDLNTQSVFDWFPLEGIGKFCFRCPSADLLRTIEEEIKDTYKDRVSVAFSSSNTLDVMKGGVSKATAIGEVLELINPTEMNPIQLSEVVAFGDSMNDKEMLAVVGVGYLMSNAQPRLKEELKDNPTCRETEVTNEEDGVANALLALFNAEE